MTVLELDSTPVARDPSTITWAPRTEKGIDHTGAPAYSARRNCRLTWAFMQLAEFETWAEADDAATHSVKLPHPDTNTATTFTGCYVRVRSGTRQLYMTNVEVEITFINV